jgi:hypothetical protein
MDSAKTGSGSKRMPEVGSGSEILAFTVKPIRIDISKFWCKIIHVLILVFKNT